MKSFFFLLMVVHFSFSAYAGMEDSVCRDDFHFQKCFGWNQETCLTEARKALFYCESAMPERPPAIGNVLEELDRTDGPGQWGILLGHCTEVALSIMHSPQELKGCQTYFEERMDTLNDNAFNFGRSTLLRVMGKPLPNIDFSKPLEKQIHQKVRGSSRKLILTSVLIILLSGLIPFVFLGWLIWTRTQRGFALVAFSLAPLSWVMGSVAHIYTGFGKAIQTYGDNPTAILPLMVGWLALGLAYWPVMYRVYKMTRVKMSVSKDI